MNYNNLEELKANISRDTLIENPTLGSVNGILLPDSHMAADANTPKPSKYHNQRTEYGHRKYPSKKQAEDAAHFTWLVGEGQPYKAYLQEVPFTLPGFTKSGRPIIHRVDHLLIDWNDKAEWYETKCNATQGRARMGELKRSQVEQLYSIKITVI